MENQKYSCKRHVFPPNVCGKPDIAIQTAQVALQDFYRCHKLYDKSRKCFLEKRVEGNRKCILTSPLTIYGRTPSKFPPTVYMCCVSLHTH